jgi:hypothetical protein
MTICITRISKLKYIPKRSDHTHRIPYIRANTAGVTGIIIAIAGTLRIAPVVKLKNLPVGSRYTHRIIDVRTPERTGTIQCITRNIVGISVTFRDTGIFKLQGLSIRSSDTNRSPDRRADAGTVTGVIVAITGALGITPVIEKQHIAILRRHANRIIDLRADVRTWANRIA